MSFVEAVDGRSKESLSVKKVENENLNSSWKGASFEPTEDEVEWLSECFVGRLKERFTWLINGNDIARGTESRIQSINLGGDMILLKDLSGDGIEFSLNYCHEWPPNGLTTFKSGNRIWLTNAE